MWVEELENGKFKYVERYTDPITNKYKRVSLTHTKNNRRVEKEMLKRLHEKIDKKLDGHTASRTLTLAELSAEWLSVYKESVKQSSFTRVKHSLNVMNRELGHIRVEDLRASRINQYFLNHLKDGRYKYNTANQIKSNISRVLKFGQTYHGLRTKTIIDALEVPKLNVSVRNNEKYLEREELKLIVEYLDYMDRHESKRMVVLQANTGMRFGEMVSLNYKEDINFEDNSISINKTYDYHNYIFTTPKTGDTRIIYFNDDIARLLKEQIKYTQLLTMSKGLPKDNLLLFKTFHGNVFQHRDLTDKMNDCGLDKHITTHWLRHTFVTLAVEKGMSKDLIAKQVGHSDTKMIDEIYAHFSEGMQKQQKEAMLDFNII